MDKKDLRVGMEVIIKKLEDCRKVLTFEPTGFQRGYFGNMAVIESVHAGSIGEGGDYAYLSFPSLRCKGIIIFHVWIEGPVAVTPAELMHWIRKERRG